MGNNRHAFTLTELLVVLVIITILAALITGAGTRPPDHRGMARITLELQQMGGALEDFKNEFGSYQPNAMANSIAVAESEPRRSSQQDMLRMFKKAFPRNKQPMSLLLALVGKSDAARDATPLREGMLAEESLVYSGWVVLVTAWNIRLADLADPRLATPKGMAMACSMREMISLSHGTFAATSIWAARSKGEQARVQRPWLR